jgi:hypothetical protein
VKTIIRGDDIKAGAIEVFAYFRELVRIVVGDKKT